MAPTKVVRWEIQSAVYSDDRLVATMDDSKADSSEHSMVVRLVVLKA